MTNPSQPLLRQGSMTGADVQQVLAERVDALTAERDRYRTALERIAYPDSRELAFLDEASEAAREALDG